MEYPHNHPSCPNGAASAYHLLAEPLDGLSQLQATITIRANPNDFRTPHESHIAFLEEAGRCPFIQVTNDLLLAALALSSGDRVLDVGCGIGDDIRAIADRVGPDGTVVGLDISFKSLTEAVQRAGVNYPGLHLIQADAHRLGFPDGHFDRSRASRILIHTADPDRIVREMVRVTRPGGRVALFEPDWGTLVIDSPLKNLTRKITEFWSDQLPSGGIGRRLPSLLKTSGLVDVACLPRSFLVAKFALLHDYLGLENILELACEHKVLTPIEVETWRAEAKKTDADGQFFASVSSFIVAGSK